MGPTRFDILGSFWDAADIDLHDGLGSGRLHREPGAASGAKGAAGRHLFGLWLHAGTEQYAMCMMTLDRDHAAADQQRRVAMAAALQNHVRA